MRVRIYKLNIKFISGVDSSGSHSHITCFRASFFTANECVFRFSILSIDSHQRCILYSKLYLRNHSRVHVDFSLNGFCFWVGKPSRSRSCEFLWINLLLLNGNGYIWYIWYWQQWNSILILIRISCLCLTSCWCSEQNRCRSLHAWNLWPKYLFCVLIVRIAGVTVYSVDMHNICM